MHKLILRYAGITDVPMIAPNQDSSFYRQFAKNINGSPAFNFMRDAWIAVVGLDLLRKVILRLRPFAAEPSQAQQVYKRSVKQWVEAMEERRSLSQYVELISNIADEFAAVPFDRKVQKPRIGIVGEIYVRSHEFANMNIIARLEELGAACDLSPLAEWIYYTNFTRSQMARRRGQYRDLLTNIAQNFLQHRIEKRIAQPLEKRFGPLAERPIEHVIKLAGPYLHHSFEGEAVLTVGKTIEYYKDGFNAVVNVMPFSCMPSTVVNGQTMRISADCAGLPILNLSFDGQEDSTLTTRLEAFVECARAHGKQAGRLAYRV